MESVWVLPVIIGPLLHAAAIAYGMSHSRRRSRRLDRLSNQKTTANYEAENNEAKAKNLD